MRPRRTSVAVPVLACLVALSAAACTGGDGGDDDDGSPTPTPTPVENPTRTFTLNGSGFQVAHVGQVVLLRVLRADGAAAWCDVSAAVPGSGTFTISSVPTAILTTGASYSLELVADIDGDAVYDTNDTNPGSPDHIYALPIGVVTTDVVMNFAHGPQSPSITWEPGLGCPGE